MSAQRQAGGNVLGHVLLNLGSSLRALSSIDDRAGSPMIAESWRQGYLSAAYTYLVPVYETS